MKKSIVLIALLALCFAWSAPVGAQNQIGGPPLDGVYNKYNINTRQPIPYEHLREADVMWCKRVWRIIDMRQKINLPLYYPTEKQAGRQSLMQVIWNAVIEEGAITAYDDEEFLTVRTAEQIKGKLEKMDTIQLQRNEPPYDWYDTVIARQFYTSDIKMIRVKEDWFFDKQRSVMDVRIIGLCPIREREIAGEDGETMGGMEGLFWIYFPECRRIFAQYDVFNRFNDAERRSFDDLFWKRTFGSYIYKESNVYDRQISMYAKGLDALLESERVKNDLFKMEHDLWEY